MTNCIRTLLVLVLVYFTMACKSSPSATGFIKDRISGKPAIHQGPICLKPKPRCLGLLDRSMILIDSNEDGCYDTCCPAQDFWCIRGTIPADTNGDGCIDSCKHIIEATCPNGAIAIDTDGDGKTDACKIEGEGTVLVICSPDKIPIDYNYDSRVDKCMPAYVPLQ